MTVLTEIESMFEQIKKVLTKEKLDTLKQEVEVRKNITEPSQEYNSGICQLLYDVVKLDYFCFSDINFVNYVASTHPGFKEHYSGDNSYPIKHNTLESKESYAKLHKWHADPSDPDHVEYVKARHILADLVIEELEKMLEE